MAVYINTKAVGSTVKLKENDTPVDYIIVHQGRPSTLYDISCDGTWLLRKDVAEGGKWHNSADNKYASSDIHGYLNNTFFARYESKIQNVMNQVKIPYHPGSQAANGNNSLIYSGASGLSCKVFLLSGYEVGWTINENQCIPPDGVKLAYFEAGTGVSAKSKRVAFNINSKSEGWWLRSPYTGLSSNSWRVDSYGNYGFFNCYSSSCLRPALILPSYLLITDDGFVITNVAPFAPPSITIPEIIRGGSTVTINWDTASDTDGNLSGYSLERSVNGASWTQIYQGPSLSYSDNITYGWQSVAYRVRAYDSFGAVSDYSTSPTRTVINNSAPSAPVLITLTGNFRGGKSAVVSWGNSTDVDGNLAGYCLERSVSGGSWAQIYQGPSLSYTDFITRGWGSVAYRARAYDADGAMSGYTTSPTYTVINNLAPAISGSDSNLGLKNDAFSQAYVISDDDGDAVTVTEMIDGSELRSFSSTLGAQNTLSISADKFRTILNGNHTISVTAIDSQGGKTVRTWTWQKDIRTMTITLKSPLNSDAAATKAAVSVIGEIPIGAQITIELCNNGYDSIPVWEDMSASIQAGRKCFFSNKTKTAASWGFNFRVTVHRMDAVGNCYINGVGGNFA